MHSIPIILKNRPCFRFGMKYRHGILSFLFVLLLAGMLFLSSCTFTGAAVRSGGGHPCEAQEGLARDDCYAQELQCSKVRNLQVRESCVAELARLKNDVGVCDLLTQEATKGFCQEQLAVLNNNHGLCRTISHEYWENNCHYALALNNSKDVYCSLISSSGQRNECFREIALASSNTLLCEHLASTDRERCISAIALKTQTPETCSELSQPLGQATCLLRIAKNSGDKEVCSAIRFKEIREDCRNLFR